MSVLPNAVKALLDRKRCELVKSLDIKHELLDDLMSNGVLSDDHYEKIKVYSIYLLKCYYVYNVFY